MKKTGFYFKKGWSEASFAYKKLNFKTKLSLFVYSFVSFIGKILFFTRPIFTIADQNIGKMISETREFNLSQAYHGCGNPKKYVGLLGSYFVQDLTILSIAFFAFLPLRIYSLNIFFNNSLVMTIFEIVAYGGSALALIIFLFRFMGVAYVGANLPDAEMSDMMYLSKTEMNGNRVKIFVPSLIQFLLTAPFYFAEVFFLIYFLNKGEHFSYGLLGFGIYVAIILIRFLFLNNVANACKTIRYEVYKDAITLKKPVVVKETSGDQESYVALFKDDIKNLEAISISQMKKKEEEK